MDTLSRYNNLKLLWWLRNIAILGQVTAVLIVTQLLKMPLSIIPILGILSASIGVNILTWWRMSQVLTVSDKEFFLQLLLDMCALGGLLYYTGGATNPFTSLFILQVVFAAVTLPPRYTWATAFVAVSFYTMLMFWNIDVPYLQHHHIGDFFSLHVQGMWVSFILLACIISWFVVRMNATIRRQDALLAEAEKMAALGTLATSAAHELGTPLSIMAVLAEDSDPALSKQFATQISRCKQILSQITEAGGVIRAEGGAPVELEAFLRQLVEEWKKERPVNLFESDIQGVGKPRIVIEHGFRQALVNLLNNAADASPDYVKFTAHWTLQILMIHIHDKGAGVAEDIQQTLGEVGVTSKAGGLGLGLFLAKSVVTRLGGKLTLENREGNGMVAVIALPIKRLMV